MIANSDYSESGINLFYQGLKTVLWNWRQLSSSLLFPNYSDAHTQHNKNVDRHQNSTMNYFVFHKRCISQIFQLHFCEKEKLFFNKIGLGFEIWTRLFFMASFDLSNLGGQMENLKFYCGKKGRFWCTFKWKYQFWLSDAQG